MRELYELKEMLCKELEEYGRKGEMTAGSLEVIDKLTHALKNLDKVIESKEMDEEEYSGAMRGGSSYRGVYDDSPEYERGTSYARGRGGNARRDSMGRYSRNSYARRRGGYSRMDKMEYIENLREMMEDATDEQTNQHMRRMIDVIQNQQ